MRRSSINSDVSESGRPVDARDQRTAEAAAVVRFKLDDEQRKRLVVREQD
jgi:hypothetical protein